MRKNLRTIGIAAAIIVLPNFHAYAADDGMTKVQLIIKKLKSSVESMKDFDELEAAGMDKNDVELLRKTMKKKINQMTSDAVALIRIL